MKTLRWDRPGRGMAEGLVSFEVDPGLVLQFTICTPSPPPNFCDCISCATCSRICEMRNAKRNKKKRFRAQGNAQQEAVFWSSTIVGLHRRWRKESCTNLFPRGFVNTGSREILSGNAGRDDASRHGYAHHRDDDRHHRQPAIPPSSVSPLPRPE
jgi:hypothetical protein